MLKYAVLSAAVFISACTGATSSSPPTVTSPTPTSVCQAIANANSLPAVQSQIASIDPQSALGQLWKYANSGCNGTTPVGGVNATWTQQMWAEVQQLAPVVLPALVGLL